MSAIVNCDVVFGFEVVNITAVYERVYKSRFQLNSAVVSLKSFILISNRRVEIS